MSETTTPNRQDSDGAAPAAAGDGRRGRLRGPRSLVTGLVLCVAVWSAASALAQATGDTGTPTEYLVTVNSCEVSTDGTTFVSLWDTPRSLDIATVAGGSSATVGDFISDLFIPTGTYTSVRCVIDDVITVTGSVVESGSGDTWFTTSGSLDCSGLPGSNCVGSFPDNTAPAESTAITIPGGDMTVTIPLGAGLPVTAGGDASFQLDFDIDGALELFTFGSDRIIVPGDPDASVSSLSS